MEQEIGMHTRASDPPLKVTREIPLWGLLTTAAAVCVQAVLMWAGQRELAIGVERQNAQLTEMTKQMNQLSVEIGQKNLKDVEHDLKLADHERRMQVIEQRGKP